MVDRNGFVASALTEHNPFMDTKAFFIWFNERKERHKFKIEQIPFDAMENWGFEATTQNLVHSSGKFFKIEGIWVETNYGYKSKWSQPIINQPEIGFLGIIAKEINGILYFLMQAKMEPGNINMIQLAPTLQATRSNFTQVHKGQKPPYLEYFQKNDRVEVLVDILQSEQGSRFYRKRNRNVVIKIEDGIEVLDDYCWLTLGQINKIIQFDNFVNMDARTVLSCIPFIGNTVECKLPDDIINTLQHSLGPLNGQDFVPSGFEKDILVSYFDRKRCVNSNEKIVSWFTQMKVRYDMYVECIPLKFVQEWVADSYTISHVEGKFFNVIAVKVEADNREVTAWTQPLVKPVESGVIAFIVKKINDVLHIIMQAKVEPGNFDVVEIAPTVQCLTGSYRNVPQPDRPPFLDFVLNATPEQVRYSAYQSEEGGRFYQEGNLNLIVEADDSFDIELPDEYIWMTISQIKELIKYNNFVNVQARCLLSCLGFY